jgi:chaperonin cofactor prefoldin
MDFPLFILVILCSVCWILYKSNQILQKAIFNLEVENSKLELKVNYLQSYKDDVSKTFKILDNELASIKQTIQVLPPTILPSQGLNFGEGDTEGPSSIFSNIFNTFLNGHTPPRRDQEPQEPHIPEEKVTEPELQEVETVADKVEKELNERESFGCIPTQYDQFKI